MKTVQKWEIASGLAALIFAIVEFFVFLSIDIQHGSEPQELTENHLLFRFMYVILPVLLMAVGSFIHVFRKSYIGFITLLVFGTITLLSKAFMFLLINSFYDYGRLADIVVALSGVFAVLTVLFALLSRKSTRLLK